LRKSEGDFLSKKEMRMKQKLQRNHVMTFQVSEKERENILAQQEKIWIQHREILNKLDKISG